MKAIRGTLRVTVRHPAEDGVTLDLSYVGEAGETLVCFDSFRLPAGSTLDFGPTWGVLRLVGMGEVTLDVVIDPLTAEVTRAG